MNYYLRALADAINGPATYAWIITKDHLYDDTYEGRHPPNPTDTEAQSDVGTSGPHDAPQELLDRLAKGEGDVFRMYDDDDNLYYTGKGLCLDDEWDERACFGPIDDYGRPNAGAVWIRWHGHPERDNG